jgi:RNA polymerase sigma-70 factor (ECF subfamily)
MAPLPRLPDLTRTHSIAMREARRLCRSLGLPAHEREDLRQELLIDFLARLPAFDPTRAELEAFALVCFRHAGARIARRVQRERTGRHPMSLDDALPRRGGLTLGDTVEEADGYAAWCGQSVDAIAVLERRLDRADQARAARVRPAADHAAHADLPAHP